MFDIKIWKHQHSFRIQFVSTFKHFSEMLELVPKWNLVKKNQQKPTTNPQKLNSKEINQHKYKIYNKVFLEIAGLFPPNTIIFCI